MAAQQGENVSSAKLRAGMSIMVNGLPGKMALECVYVALERGFDVVPIGLAGSRNETMAVKTVDSDSCGFLEKGEAKRQRIEKSVDIQLVPASPQLSHTEAMQRALLYANSKDRILMVIDFTTPTAVGGNIELYTKMGVPFVSGTTSSTVPFEEVLELVKNSSKCQHTVALKQAMDSSEDISFQCCKAVIAPNMNKQIVAFQAMFEWTSENFPSCFDGYSLSIKESHQKTKKDTSGTAKAVVASMAKLTKDGSFGVSSIEKVRDDEQAVREMGVPSKFVDGHAYHTYKLQNSSVKFEFQHNVDGRRSYAEGTLDACEFVLKQCLTSHGSDPEKLIFNMIDVLRAG